MHVVRYVGNIIFASLLYAPPLVLCVLIVFNLYERANPWPPAQPALGALAPMNWLLFGYRDERKYSISSAGEQRSHLAIRSYLIIPRTGPMKLLLVSQKNNQPPEISQGDATATLLSVGAVVVASAVAWTIKLRRTKSNAA